VHDSMTARFHSLHCPFCEDSELEPFGHNSLRCASCGTFLTGTLLETLRQIIDLPDVVGGHACECGHPENETPTRRSVLVSCMWFGGSTRIGAA
jgi:ribosomal protein S27E